MKFYYFDDTGAKKYLTLKKAAPEWCNLDCPAIYIEDDPTRWNGWILLSNGLVLEDGNSDLYALVKKFVERSSEAFYRRYPTLRSQPGKNGFMRNFINNVMQYQPELITGEVA